MATPLDLTSALGDIKNDILADIASGGIQRLARAGWEATAGHPIRAGVRITAGVFSTRLPAAERALHLWLKSNDFLGELEKLGAGLPTPANDEHAELFIRVTGIAFGTARRSDIQELLQFFYTEVHKQLCLSREGPAVIGASVRSLHEKFDRFIERHDSKPSAALESGHATLSRPRQHRFFEDSARPRCECSARRHP